MTAILCSFTDGLEDMRRADQSNPVMVMRILVASGRFSVFEATANDTIARMMTRLYHKTLIYRGKKYPGPLLKMDHSMGYPWTKVVITESGKALLSDWPSLAPKGAGE